ncbi:TAT-variant-translocated molybdopterin oxidoreductase [Gaetbulibacter sp. M240]|uniref:TAT-variant-translocated molybdopterin oxidoreductase n=1 Tax=Gaetbulibacter sp. M240 TaxID=3126511 RepID=UPI00374E24F7
MSSNKKYWKSVEELNENSSIVETLRQNEFVEEIPTDEFLGDKDTLESTSTTRRDFLKYVGFSTAAASLAACEGPVKKSIPYVQQPQEIVPGVANYYATTIADGYDFASVLVKTREGRPIKIDRNTLAEATGNANARVNASILGLYDSLRLQSPKKGGESISWGAFYTETKNKLTAIAAANKPIVLLTQTFASPSTSKLISEFQEKYGNVKHVVYDAISESATLDAYQAKYGERALPNYDFSEAEVIVSIGADFLGDWQGGGFDSSYAKSRVPHEGKMSRHIQFESNMSLTGANADKRVPLKPSEQKLALAKLYSYVVGGSVSGSLPEAIETAVKKAASQLKRAGSKGVVVTGIQDANAQTVVLEINEYLKSTIFDKARPIYTRQGSDKAVADLISDMKAGTVGAVIMCGVNPLYTLPNSNDFAEGLKQTELSVAFSMKSDETSSQVEYVAATPHFLESWGDTELKKGHFGLMQPTIRPLFDTKQFQDVLLTWNDNPSSYHDYIKETWGTGILGGSPFNKALHDGVFMGAIATETPDTVESPEENETMETAMGEAARALAASAKAASGGLELTLYTKIGMGDGRQANNPWLQEFPDPITRTSWDNYLTVSKYDADALELVNTHVSNGALNGSYANVTVNGTTIKVPVIIQPGQAKGSVGLALGYGRTSEGMKDEMKTGVNAYKFYQNFNTFQEATVGLAEGEHEFACVQLQNTMVGRGDIIRETTLEVFNTKDKHYWNEVEHVSYDHNDITVRDKNANIWEDFDRSVQPHFNLSIDLNACTGCGACIIACHSENNVPVVGKREVRKFRDMHWLRVDRYYSSNDTFEQEREDLENLKAFETYTKVETQSYDNPEVAFQPVMCQHCNHAPCETVCPVAATSHGRQGQNQMVYNRCIGTRYCANNCPYKVRRFNWFLYSENDEFDYYMNDDLGRMVLNPDVVVRSRGVMEKCSMCIQKTQKTILDAKREGREVKDGEFQTACSAACNNGAMVFGDINNKEAKIVEKLHDDRMYHLLEGVGTKPNVMYQAMVKNTTES